MNRLTEILVIRSELAYHFRLHENDRHYEYEGNDCNEAF